MLVYATREDLENWTLTAAPDNARALLRAASRLVAKATRTAVYDTDETGMPTDPDVIEAMRDATCSQVATWVVLKIDPAAAGADAATGTGRVVTGKTLGPASLQFAGVESAQARRADLAARLNVQSENILAEAGLLSGPIAVTG